MGLQQSTVALNSFSTEQTSLYQIEKNSVKLTVIREDCVAMKNKATTLFRRIHSQDRNILTTTDFSDTEENVPKDVKKKARESLRENDGKKSCSFIQVLESLINPQLLTPSIPEDNSLICGCDIDFTKRHLALVKSKKKAKIRKKEYKEKRDRAILSLSEQQKHPNQSNQRTSFIFGDAKEDANDNTDAVNDNIIFQFQKLKILVEKNEQNVKSKMKKATRISKEEISQTPQEDEKFYEDLLRDIQLVEYTLKIEREKKAECELVNDQFMNSHIKIYPGNSLEKHAVSYNNSRAQYEQQLHHHLNENNESTKLKCKSSCKENWSPNISDHCIQESLHEKEINSKNMKNPWNERDFAGKKQKQESSSILKTKNFLKSDKQRRLVLLSTSPTYQHLMWV